MKVGDYVKVIGDEFKGETGYIEYVSSYGDSYPISVAFDNGTTEVVPFNREELEIISHE